MKKELLEQRYKDAQQEINRLRAELSGIKKSRDNFKEKAAEVTELKKENQKLQNQLYSIESTYQDKLERLDEKWYSKYYNLQQQYYACKKFKDGMYRLIGGEEVRKIRKNQDKELQKAKKYIDSYINDYIDSKEELEGFDAELLKDEVEEMDFEDKRQYNGKI